MSDAPTARLIPFGRRFLAHHADVHPELREILSTAEDNPPALLPPLLARVSLQLRGLFRTAEPVLTLPGPVALLREIGLRSVVEHRALVVVAGPDGDELATAAEALGKEVIRVVVRAGQTLDPAHLARFLAGPEVDTVVLSHADLGAGTLAPLAELARVVRATRRDLMLFVDASGSLGASPLETDQWGLDFVLGGSEGALGLPAGLAFAAVSPRLLARLRSQAGRGVQLDLVAHHTAATQGQVLGTVPAPMARALARQLERILECEGLEQRWARHAALSAMIAEWADARPGLRLPASPDRRGHAVTLLELDTDRAATEVVTALAAAEWYLSSGPATEPRHLRIGHMGDLEPAHLSAMLEALGRVMQRG